MGLNKLRDMFKENRASLGTFLDIANMSLVECLGYTGLDFVIIDDEHGPWDTETMQNLIRASELVGLSPVVRIAKVDHKEIQRAADCGADCLIIPCLRDVEEFKEAVRWAKFAPVGQRGFIKGRGARFGNAPWADTPTLEEYMENSNEKLIVMPQCETQEALDNIEEIVKIDGVDAIFIGPFDLSVCMGIPGQFTNPDFIEARRRILRACHSVNKPCYIFSTNAEDSAKYIKEGYDGVAHDTDFSILVQGFRKAVSDIQEKLGE